jgi:predicted DNA binding CopG/RHH family protein
MSNNTPKIASTDEAWDSAELGASEEHAKAVNRGLEAEVDASLGLQAISIRLPKQLIDAYKLIAAHHGIGYQPLMRDILQRFVPEGLKEVLQHHEVKAEEVDHQIEEWKKAA